METTNPYDPDKESSPPTTESRILTTYLLHPSPLTTITPLTQFKNFFSKAYQSHAQLRPLYRDLQFQRNLDLETVRVNIEREVQRGTAQRNRLFRQLQQELRDSDGAALHEINNNSVKTTRGSNKSGLIPLKGSTKSTSPSSKRKRDAEHNVSMRESPENEMIHPEGQSIDIALDAAFLLSTPHSHHQYTNLPTHSKATKHTLSSLLSTMSQAAADVEAESAEYENEASAMLEEMKEIVGGLSDLRYGKFRAPGGRGVGINGETTLEREVEMVLRRFEEEFGRTTGA